MCLCARAGFEILHDQLRAGTDLLYGFAVCDDLRLVQPDRDGKCPVAVDPCRNADRYPADAVHFTFHIGRHGQDPVFIAKDCLNQRCNRLAGAIHGRPLVLDDLLPARLHGMDKLLDREMGKRGQVLDLDPADRCCRPERHHAVAMLPDDTGMDFADMDLEIRRNQGF